MFKLWNEHDSGNQGFAITLPNNWTISVQFGSMGMCDNDGSDNQMIGYQSLQKSINAEVACYYLDSRGERDWYVFNPWEVKLNDAFPQRVIGYQSVSDLLDLIDYWRKLPAV
jgi:hypothetical protein